ncbi:MAG: U32 family peptidase [Eubacteriales bacterium]|nr:U32 family peptidase [Eubacteriales bacterium]MDD3349476.1 U32 family peptidase [Eubacteriales bacterium]
MKKIELLAPAGDYEKLKMAIEYGADAVYCGASMFGLRAGAKNFSGSQLSDAVNFVHERGKKIYLALNIFAHNEDIKALEDFLDEIKNLDFDAFIVSDPGILSLIKRKRAHAVIHLSTQANTTNYSSASFWHSQGVKRIVLARELSFAEIRELRENTAEDLELEAFVHGAMCISYSGRCLLSSFMAGRDANRGECAHPCRWKYHLVEEQRPGEYHPINEDERGSYIFNSKDLCMIEHIPDLIASGLTSLKIEGRTKSIFYVATVVAVYRKAIDAYYEDPASFCFQPEWLEELEKVSHRLFSTGFYYSKTTEDSQNYETSQYVREYSFVGLVKDYDPLTGIAKIEQRNKMDIGDEIEVFGPSGTFFKQKIDKMWDEYENEISSAPHAQQQIRMHMDLPVKENYMVRKAK